MHLDSVAVVGPSWSSCRCRWLWAVSCAKTSRQRFTSQLLCGHSAGGTSCFCQQL